MAVRCERCGAECELDEGRIDQAGLSVECSRCHNVFIVRKKAVVVTEPAHGTKAPSQPLGGQAPSPQFEDFSFAKSPESARAARFEMGEMSGWHAGADEPAFAREGPRLGQSPSADDLSAAPQRSSNRSVYGMALLLAMVGVSYLSYRYFVWMPQRQREAPRRSAAARAAGAQHEAPVPERGDSQGLPPTVPDTSSAKVIDPLQPAPSSALPPSKAKDALPPAKTSGSAKAIDAPRSREMSDPLVTETARDAAAPAKPPVEVPSRSPEQPKELAEVRPQTDTSTTEGRVPPPATGNRAPKQEPPGNFDSYMEKADRLREREQPRAALEAYKKAAELEPARPEPLAGRGLALLDLGRTAPAIAAFQQALKVDPRHGVALMGLAEAYRLEGNKEEAVRYYEKYLAVIPDGPEAQVAKAAIKALQE